MRKLIIPGVAHLGQDREAEIVVTIFSGTAEKRRKEKVLTDIVACILIGTN